LIKENDRIVGVIAETSDGYKRFNASKGVILATGDIGSDKEMLAEFCPIALKPTKNQYIPLGSNTGDGHKMGAWAGGVLEDGPWASMMHPQGYSRMAHFFLYVNTMGKRFMNEDTWAQGKSLGVLKQPGDVDYAYAIFDANYKEEIEKTIPIGGGLFWDNPSTVYGQPWTSAKDEGYITAGLKDGTIIQADTLEDLAKGLNVPVDTFMATVNKYNESAKNGDDTEFGKRAELLFPIEKPPYYGSKFGPCYMVVLGGLNIDTSMRVLDKDNNPIPGLFAIGNVSGGLYGVDYPTLIPGNSHGRAVTWGYIAGNAITA
jgi:succinate dehydrogenase/fumarate reductase flavoprotein subunit